jgi:long-chain acyl-CoA synthetase
VSITTHEHRIYSDLHKEWTRGDSLLSVSQLLPRAAQKFGNRTALEAPDRVMTYAQWWHEVLRAAQWLRAEGVQRGDRVMIFANNSCEFYVAYFAIWHLGGIAVPLNVYFHERELAGVIADGNPRLILTRTAQRENVTAALTRLDTATVLVHNLDEVLWQEPYDATAVAALEKALPAQHFASDETAVILYTSGTTGVPKGVMLSSKNVVTNALQVLARFEVVVGTKGSDRFLSILPLFHVFAQNTCCWLPVMLGASIIIVPRIERRALREGLQKSPTMFFGFPALYGLLALMKTAPLDSVRLFVSGADALPDKIRAAFAMVYGRKICSGYGLTEASPVVAADGLNYDKPTNTVGELLQGITCQIRDDAGTALATGEVGTLWVKGDNIMQGYYNAPEQTARVLVNGWLNTGDLACVNERGEVLIAGRSKDLIINKGFNIYPQEVENILLRHPAVIKAAVLGRPEGGSGEVPVAFIALRDGYKVQQSELAALCKENLASYKVPRTITQLADLPMTATGKIDKKKLGSA